MTSKPEKILCPDCGGKGFWWDFAPNPSTRPDDPIKRKCRSCNGQGAAIVSTTPGDLHD